MYRIVRSLLRALGVPPFGLILAFSGVLRRSRVGKKIFATAPTPVGARPELQDTAGMSARIIRSGFSGLEKRLRCLAW